MRLLALVLLLSLGGCGGGASSANCDTPCTGGTLCCPFPHAVDGGTAYGCVTPTANQCPALP
jgi:hypothetical protein